jgi:type IV secretion system protein VirB11
MFKAKDVVILMASSMDFEAGVIHPVVQGELPDVPPFDGARFHGVLPPNVNPQASFDIRKLASLVYSLEEYVEKEILRPFFYEVICTSITQRRNILVVGGTGSGKTTFLNALIKKMSDLCPDDRVLILEDTRELKCESLNKVFLRTSDFLDMNGLVKTTLRFRPHRILVGEVRDRAALDLLKAWNTGHPGGFATIHANSAEKGLPRLEMLAREAGEGTMHELVGEAVDLVLFIEERAGKRKVSQAMRVYAYEPLTQTYKTEVVHDEH